jgi:putative membrane protein
LITIPRSSAAVGCAVAAFEWLFWILVLIGLVLLIKYLWESGAKRGDSALEILKIRYVRGEISKEEFEEKKKDIL